MRTENKTVKTRVELDTLHSLDISVNEFKQTVVAELIVYNEKPVFIYAESFDMPCNYLRTAIKKGIAYIEENSGWRSGASDIKKAHKNSFLSG